MTESRSLDQFHLNSNACFGKGHKIIAHILSYYGENSCKEGRQGSNPYIFSSAYLFPKVRSISHGINLQLDHFKKNLMVKGNKQTKTLRNIQLVY